MIVQDFDAESPEAAHERRSHLYVLDGLLGFVEETMMRSGPHATATRSLWARYRLAGGERPYPIRLGDLSDEVFRLQERWLRAPHMVSVMRPTVMEMRRRRSQQAMLDRLRAEARAQAPLLAGDGPFATSVRRDLFHRALSTRVVRAKTGSRYYAPPVDLDALVVALDAGDSATLERLAADLHVHYRASAAG